MILKLQSTEEVIAEADIRCDAREIIFDLGSKVDNTDKLKHQMWTLAMIYVKKRNIKKGASYLRLNFLDAHTKEVYEFNCDKENHEYCLKYNLYTPIIKVAI